jgi:hypothetical protein
MRARWSRLVPLCFALLAGAAAGRADEAKAPPHLPSGVTPLPQESAKHIDELMREAEKYRGLKALRSVPAGSTSPRKLKKQIKAAMPKDLPAADLKALEVSLKAFGLIPETMDLGRYLPELMSSQVAGFYDPDDKYMTLVDTPRVASKKEKKAKDEGQDEKAEGEDMVLVHELTHALQDQHFNLHRFEERDPMSDLGAAKKALVEGDATLTMIDAGLKMSFEAMPGMDAILASMMRDPEKLLAGSADFPGAKEMSAAPAWIRDNLMFSYFQGLSFCVSAKRQGGQVLLDYAFTTDPPRSSEQILHPEKWHTRRDDPVGLRFPDLAAELPGYRKAAEGEMGELGLRILFRQDLKSREQADAAAAGWGGDRFAVYEKGGGRLIVWISEWDAEADAGEFRSALQAATGWRAEAAGPTRVLAVRGSLPDEAWTKVRARLATVTAEKPANKEIDLKALGAKPSEMDEESLKNLMDSPAVQEAMTHDLKKERAAGIRSEDGRTYTNPLVGFSIRIPEPLQDWRLKTKIANPQSLLSINDPDSKVFLTVGYMPLPADVPAASMTGLVELGIKAVLPDYQRLREESGERPGYAFQDLWFTVTVEGTKLNGVLRCVGRGSQAFFIVAMGQVEPWEEQKAAVLSVMDTFTLFEPKKEAP